MIKSHKLEMLALIDTMRKMADLLPKLPEPAEQIQDILAACQCLRENLNGENVPESTVLLQNIECALNENQLDIIKFVKKLESAFKSEVKAKKEVLFLPYKISMWDSLESIYLTAKEDHNCEVLVMPIPYYDKKDGKFTDMHWEINYPKNIALIDYRKYDIEERRPDIIFIHNPYDDLNIVTSIHPNYFCQKLKNLTDCLVYVPYFVGPGTHIQEHFCTLPGCIHAHKVIVQTEKEREIYVKEYRKATSDSGNKFLALGSPKLDKAISTKRDDYELPQEWKKMIDGKKVIFYNTSIGALLEHSIEDNKPSNKYLQKIKNVLEFFKKRDDAVLLWRPHPLFESTIKSMRPWLSQEYAEIVSEYKRNRDGIYDDTEDLNRAIAVSDAYYGDGSSVGHLFKVAGKPVVWQEFGNVQPQIAGIYDEGSGVWFTDCYNMLYKYNKQNKEAEYIGIIPAKNFWANVGIAENNKKLYFAPHYKNDKISIFDIDKNEFEQIDFKKNCVCDRYFSNAISFKNFIYFIPWDYPAIMRLNTDTKEIEYFSDFADEVSKLQVLKIHNNIDIYKNRSFFAFCVVDAEISIVMHRANAVMFFNMETGSYEIKSVGEKSEQYNHICFDGQNYYLTPFQKDYIIKWNRLSSKTTKIKIPSFSRKKWLSANFSIKYLNGYVWLFPYAANGTYKINTGTNEISELPELTEYYNNAFASENNIYISTRNKGIVEYNTSISELNRIKFNFETDPLLLTWLYNYDNFKEGLKTSEEPANSGKRIWEYLNGVQNGSRAQS